MSNSPRRNLETILNALGAEGKTLAYKDMMKRRHRTIIALTAEAYIQPENAQIQAALIKAKGELKSLHRAVVTEMGDSFFTPREDQLIFLGTQEIETLWSQMLAQVRMAAAQIAMEVAIGAGSEAEEALELQLERLERLEEGITKEGFGDILASPEPERANSPQTEDAGGQAAGSNGKAPQDDPKVLAGAA